MEGCFFCFSQKNAYGIIHLYKVLEIVKKALTSLLDSDYYDLTRNVCNVYDDTTLME